ncbi:MAG: GNAT family N-acetyltransferase [Chloroflexi bacterium]|nr:GNAT family N-acetyltransferase [Chloroflexota bacterium]
MSLQIEQVQTSKQLRQFLKVPWLVYKNDPNWVPWLYHDRLAAFTKSKHPFFDHADADFFIARRDGVPVGIIAAIFNNRHNWFHEENIAHFGAFEVLDDPEAAQMLLETAVSWAKERKADKILGPMNLSTNDECALLVDGFDSPPIIMMTYNPPYYADLLEANGFIKAMDLWAWHADMNALINDMPEKLVRVVGKVKKRYNLIVRNLNMKDWDNEVERVRTIYNSAWERNWGFVPMTDAEFDHLAEGLRLILDPAISFIVEKDGEPVGVSISLPDANQPLHKWHPGPTILGSYLGAIYSLLNRKRADFLRVLILGVIEQYRGKGIDALMYYETTKAGVANGYKFAEASWILENNDMMNRSMEMMGAKVYKTYRVYEKAVS